MSTLEKRRIARIPIRCMVVVREKLATWDTETQDVGGRGCRIMLKRPVAPGALLQLRFETGAGSEPLEVVGQVTWVRKSPPLAAGIAFVSAPRVRSPGGAEGNWIDRLVVAHLRDLTARGSCAGPSSLGSLGAVTLRLGKPPGRPLYPSELAIVEVARNVGTLSTVASALDGPTVLATLLEEGIVTVGPATVDPLAWKRAAALPAAATRATAPRTVSPSTVIIPPPAPEPERREAIIDAAIARYLRTG